jgi:hypothetical protein
VLVEAAGWASFRMALRRLNRIGEAEMTVYKLFPIVGTESALAWQQSYCREICWVNADSDTEARKKVTAKTAKTRTLSASGEGPPGWPWENPSLSICTIDEAGVSVPPGKVLGESGKLYGD